jgi:hypothetical protein
VNWSSSAKGAAVNEDQKTAFVNGRLQISRMRAHDPLPKWKFRMQLIGLHDVLRRPG